LLSYIFILGAGQRVTLPRRVIKVIVIGYWVIVTYIIVITLRCYLLFIIGISHCYHTLIAIAIEVLLPHFVPRCATLPFRLRSIR
jgi:hypothetical protein